MARRNEVGTALVILALGLSSAACSKGHHHGGNSHEVVVHNFAEVEPNDFAATANYFGTIAVGETLIVHGFIEDSGFDPFDGFAFTTLEPMDIEFYLTSDDPFADLDLCYYNPYTGQQEACWQTAFNESGLLALNGGEDFHLVVASYFGYSNYTLELIGRPIGYAPAAAPAPAAQPRERDVPFADYGQPPLAEAAREEPAAPSARGRVILLDPADGSVVTQDFELGAQGALLGAPVQRS